MSKLASFRKTNLDDAGSRLQDNVANVFNSLQNIAILDGNLITATIGTTSTPVAHKLGRPCRGYIVCGSTSYGVLKTATTPSIDLNLIINLQSSVSGTFTLWVF